MANFEGAGAYLGFGYEVSVGVPGTITDWTPLQSETLNPKYIKKDNPNITGRRSTQKGRLLGIDANGGFKVVPDAESTARLHASFMGKVVTTPLSFESLTTALVPANSNLKYTSKIAGDQTIRVRYVDPAAASAALSVAVSGQDITVNLATSAGSVITSTAAQIAAAIAAAAPANALVAVVNAPGNSGAGVVTAMAYAALTATAFAYQHVLTNLLPGDATPATYRDSFDAIIYRDDSRPMLMLGGRVSSITDVIKARDYVEETIDMIFDRFTRQAQPVANGGNNVAFTGKLYTRGVRRDPANVTDSIFVKVVVGGALDGTAKVTAKIGAATAYDDTKLATPLAEQWFDINDSLGVPAGVSLSTPVQGLFHKLLVGDVLTVGDIWEITPRIPVAAPTYSTAEVFDGSQVVAIVGGKQYQFKAGTVKGTKAKSGEPTVGSVYSGRILDNGLFAWTLELDRNYIDTDFIDSVEGGASADVTVTMTGDDIGSTGIKFSKQYHWPAMSFLNAGTNVANANAEQEKVTLSAYDNQVNPICTLTFVNTIPAL